MHLHAAFGAEARRAMKTKRWLRRVVGKQAQRSTRCQHFAPVKVCARYGVGCPLGKALLPCHGANGVQRFLLQQGLVSVQGVQAFEPALQVVAELVGGELHGGSLASAAALG